ncbi:DUF4192 family protein [Microbacterium sp. A82]|uniref:DUF4192 family protein n=1 Tax=Microbacterium sp. A82 TaxID=3450452 RepID=UPI003F3D705D
MNTVLRATDSAEFLGIVPTLAGFRPRQSVVLLPFHDSRTHGAMRIDLPRPDVDLNTYVDTAVELITRVDGMNAIAVVVYTDEYPQHTPDGIVLPSCVLVDNLLEVVDDLGLRIVDALCVNPEGWSSYLDDDPVLQPLDVIPEPAAPPELDVDTDQDAGAELPKIGVFEQERVARALRDLTAFLSADEEPRNQRINPQAIEASGMLDDLPQFFEDALDDPENMPPYAAAGLLWCLNLPSFRDSALLQWATDLPTGVRALAAQLAYAHEAETISDELGMVLLGRGIAPDPERLKAALALTQHLAARAPRAARPAPLTLAAWLSWALGRSTHTARYLDAVAEIDPAYSMARLIDVMTSAAVLPEWVFQRGGA